MHFITSLLFIVSAFATSCAPLGPRTTDTRFVIAPGRPLDLTTSTPAISEPMSTTRVAFRMPDVPATARPLPASVVLDRIPVRPDDAPTGSAFLDETESLSIAVREERILAEFLSGNIPSHLRTMTPIRLVGRTEKGFAYYGMAWVMPDFLAIGDDHDFVRIPMNPSTAQAIADAYGCSLTTSKLSDAAYAQATVQLEPRTLTPSRAMRSNAYLREHEARIAKQLGTSYKSGELIAGHKKDVLLASRLSWRPKRVAIYGWHLPTGEPIQPLSTWHKKSYSDYSHGVRLALPTIQMEDSEWTLADALRHPTLSLVVSDEGPYTTTTIDPAPPEFDVEELGVH